jgi:GT2 family glycosyltransferase
MLSIIICSQDDQKFDNILKVYQRFLPRVEFEIIRLKDATSLTSGYNLGVRQAKYDRLIFCHDDIVILDRDFAGKLMRRLDQYDILGIAGTNRLCDGQWPRSGPAYIFGHVIHLVNEKEKKNKEGNEEFEYKIEIYNTAKRVFTGIQAMDGLFLATHRRVVERISFDEKTFDGFHMYDMDFTFRAYLAGLKLAVCADMSILHFSRGRSDENYWKYHALFNEKHRGNLAARSRGIMDVAYNIVGDLQAAEIFINNPLWEPLS